MSHLKTIEFYREVAQKPFNMAATKKYGLIIPAGKSSGVQKKPLQKLSVFGDDSDEEDGASLVNKSLSSQAKKTALRKQTQLEVAKALSDDPTVYEYDSIYDDIQAKKESFKPAAKKEVDKKPKYIAGLLKAAEKRKKENERRVERTVQKEREEEGEKYADKEAFVTSAYKKKMQEMQEAEERERREAELEAKNDVTKQSDMSGFYRHILDQRTGGVVPPEGGTEQPVIKSEPNREATQLREESKRKAKSYRRRRSHSESSSDGEDSRRRSEVKGHHNSSEEEKSRAKEGGRSNKESKSVKSEKSENEDLESKRKTDTKEWSKSDGHPDSDRCKDFSETKLDKSESEPILSKDAGNVSGGDNDNPDADSPNDSSSDEEDSQTSKEKTTTVNPVKSRMEKFARRNVGETLNDARARFLARKQARVVAVMHD